MNLKRKALKLHKDNKGKLMVKPKVSVSDEEDLSLAYSPGVAEPCLEIADIEETIFDHIK